MILSCQHRLCSLISTHTWQLKLECMGKYLLSIVEVQDAKRCFVSAHECYLKWGATALAARLYMEHNLESCSEDFQSSVLKHRRDE